MKLEEFYQNISVDYNDVLKRLLRKPLVLKYLNMFLKDQTYVQLKEALQNQQGEEAFRHAHTLKGLCLNLELKSIVPSIVQLTDDLRNHEITSQVEDEFVEFSKQFESLCLQIQEVLKEEQNI